MLPVDKLFQRPCGSDANDFLPDDLREEFQLEWPDIENEIDLMFQLVEPEANPWEWWPASF